ncbi:MAG: hypothetical protein WAK48_23510 [Candidatus Acidiferrum sp.]|jgi:hypothetical protein
MNQEESDRLRRYDRGSTPEEIARLTEIWNKVTANPRPLELGHPHIMMVNLNPRPVAKTKQERIAQLEEIHKERVAYFHKKWARLLCPPQQ